MRWLKSQYSSRLARAERQLSLAKMQNSLASAAIDARRGDCETARLAASDFFTALRAETSTDVDSVLSQAQKDGAQPLLALRDETITLLARGDVASADLLSDLYVSFRSQAE
jgi:cytochrome P450